ncbi:MAG: cytochrome b/b6 domain-containing protein [Burkholderiales bacterium]|jgi:cytochrome b561|nr:cytochrome b/b6 domain-containing protein [Burkholderiales bacterium]
MNRPHFSRLHRFLHWTIALCILLALFTAFLRATWMNGQEMATVITASLAEKAITLSNDDAKNIAKTIRSPMFQWHFYAGYVLVALLLLRFFDLFKNGAKFISSLAKGSPPKEKLQGALYIFLYAALTVVLIMGLLLKFGPKGDIHEVFEVIHVYGGVGIALFVAAHFAGLWLGENTTDKGIVSKMINGG